MPRFPIGRAVALLLASVVIPGVSSAAWPSDPAVNVPVCTAVGDQYPLAACTDGAGGMFVAWSDLRTGAHDLYATHLNSLGVVVAGWPTNGLAVCTASGDQTNPAIVSDGAGGAIVIWQDGRNTGNADIYAQRLGSAGTVVAGWPALASNGLLLAAAPNKQWWPVAVSDGAGGAIVAWQDLRNGVDENIYAQHVLASGGIAPGWNPNGDSLCVVAGDQSLPTIASDGAGGAFVAWTDHRGADDDVYAQHITGTGAIASGWPSAITGGLPLSTQTGDDNAIGIGSDGFGGAYIAWFGTTSNAYRAQRVAANGTVVAGWPSAASGGLSLGVSTNLVQPPAVIPDGAGGAMIAGAGAFPNASYTVHVGAGGSAAVDWTDFLTAPSANAGTESYSVGDGFGGIFVVANFGLTGGVGSLDLIASHYTSTGALATGWSNSGNPLTTAPNAQLLAALVPDGTGGLLAAWADMRDSAATGVDIYAQRIERYGHLGDPGPQIVSVRDVPNDQGGEVRVAWNASYLDAYPALAVSSYNVWRQVPATLAEAALRLGAHLWHDASTPTGPWPLLRVSRESAQTYYWQLIASQPAYGLAGYSIVAATTSDSVAGSNPLTLFQVQAIGGSAFWFSAPDSGYSVDNLPPAIPAGLAGTFVSGSGAFLSWSNDAEPDLAGYHLYRGSTPGFVPTPAGRIATLTSPGYTDPGASPAYYKLSAFDIHGNESGFASLLPQGTAGVGHVPAVFFALDEPRPNPTRTGTFALSFSLPAQDPARIEVVDAGGRAWVTRDVGALGAGAHVVEVGADRRLPPGMYFVRLTQGRQRGLRRVVVLE